MAAYNVGYTVATVAVSSTTVPVSLIPPGFMSGGFYIRNRAGSASSVLIFPYVGTLPGSAPANTLELSAGVSFNDNITGSASGQDAGIGSGWAAVLETGGSATVDSSWR